MELTIKCTLKNQYVQFYEIWNGRYIGQLHYENRPRGIYIHITLIPEYHRKGIGRFFVENTIGKAREQYGARDVVALIREDNQQSINFFKGLNFKYAGGSNKLIRFIDRG